MVSGCAVERIQLPDFELAERDKTVEVTDPVEYTVLCVWPWTTAECLQRLDVFEDEAIDNKKLAQTNADIARASDASYDHILSGATKQQSIALIREETLEIERKDHFIDNLWHRGLILVMAIGMVL